MAVDITVRAEDDLTHAQGHARLVVKGVPDIDSISY